MPPPPVDSVLVIDRSASMGLADGEVTRLQQARSPRSAQKLYTWTDENGILHITDHPPPQRAQIEEVVTYKERTPEEQQAIDREAGRLTREINGLHGPAFGYVAQPEHHAASWRLAFDSMLEGVLADGCLVYLEEDRSRPPVKLPDGWQALKSAVANPVDALKYE